MYIYIRTNIVICRSLKVLDKYGNKNLSGNSRKKMKNYLTVAIVAWGLVIVASVVLAFITVFAAIGSAAGGHYYYR